MLELPACGSRRWAGRDRYVRHRGQKLQPGSMDTEEKLFLKGENYIVCDYNNFTRCLTLSDETNMIYNITCITIQHHYNNT